MNPDRSYNCNASIILSQDPQGPEEEADVMDKDYCGVCQGICRCKEACEYED